jgi:nucleotide-binding universal stress UspA family protein
MKTILIPTNFTDIARHATDYALQLYGKNKIKVVLLNAFEQPRTGRTIPLSLLDIMRKNSEKGLFEDKLRIEEDFNHLDIEVEVRAAQGDLSDAIRSVLSQHPIDIIVMGSKGNQELVDMFVESAAARVIKVIDHPMLIVPPIARINSLKHIIFTTDCKPLSDNKILDEMKYLCRENDCDVKVLNISKGDIVKSPEMEKQIDSYLGSIKHDFNYRKNNDIPTAIYKFIHETDADIVTLVKRKGAGSLVDRFFHVSVSKRIVKHVRQTLLLFSDQDY